MKNILVLGAGRSSSALIQYLLKKSEENGWFVTVADTDIAAAEKKINTHQNGKATCLDVLNLDERRSQIERSDVVVSLLPAHLHLQVAHDCIKLKKHLVTASFTSKEMYELNDEVRKNGLIFMNELGLDPGIDHMSAMQKIDEIKAKGGNLTAFRSYTGGLVAPENDDNPWNYKFTWNPRNVILAGQGTAQFLEDGKHKYIPYQRIFQQYRTIHVSEMGEYDGYANRDSLIYRKLYGLSDIQNILRGTIRHKGFCNAWDALVRLGLTDDSFTIMDSESLTYYELLESYLGDKKWDIGTLQERVASLLNIKMDSEVMKKLVWLGLFEHLKINLIKATPAFILEHLLLEKWKLMPQDKDMILMQHEFEYTLDGAKRLLTSTLVMKGENATDTAMSRLVGLPLGIFVRLIMQENVLPEGVNIPVMKEVYEPILEELEQFGVVFKEKDKLI